MNLKIADNGSNTFFSGAKMVTNIARAPYTEIHRDIRLYVKTLYF